MSIPIRAGVSATVGGTLKTVLQVNTAGKEYLAGAFTVATAALDQFVIAARVHDGGHLAVIASAAGDYTSPGGDLVAASGDLTIASTSGVHWFSMTVGAFEIIEIQCASGSTSDIDLQVSGS